MQEFLQHFRATVEAKGGRPHCHIVQASSELLAMVLPIQADIQVGDRLHGGAAVQVEGDTLTLYAFFLRQICTNGMVRATEETRQATFQIGEKAQFVAALDITLAQLAQRTLPAQAQALTDSMGRPISMNEIIGAAWHLQARVWREQQAAAREAGTLSGRLKALEASRAAKPVDRWQAARHARNRAMDLSGRLLREVETEMARPVNARRARRGMTAFDLINGITAMARDERDPRTQVAWMQLAQEILVTGSARMILPEEEGEAALYLETFVAG